MQNIKIINLKPRKKNININKKTFFVAFIFMLILGLLFDTKYIRYQANILEKKVLLTKLDNIKDTSVDWPVKYVTNWGVVTDYEKTKRTPWENLEDDKKTIFPQIVSDTIEKYRYLPLAKVWEKITNPFERQKLIFLKRLITTTWTASYDCKNDDCKRWIPDSGTHAGIDIVSSIKTPIYSISNGIVYRIEKPCPSDKCKGFGNYIVIVSNINGNLIASIYAHLESIDENIKVGDVVKKGQIIGYLGNSGNSTTPHLHFQINKIGTENEIKNIELQNQIFVGGYNNIDLVKAKTYDPIRFIQDNMFARSDAFGVAYEKPQEQGITSTSQNKSDDFVGEIIDKIKENETKEEPKLQAHFQITKLILSKIDTKLSKNDKIQATIYTTGDIGTITISTKNSVLTPSQYFISPNGQTQHIVYITASNAGNGQIVFDDGKEKKSYYFTVYENSADVFGLGIVPVETVYISKDTNITVFPVDRFGNKIFTNLNGQIKVILENKGTNETATIKQGSINQDSMTFSIKPKNTGNYKLKVFFTGRNGKNFMVSKNLISDIFVDYSINDKYGVSIKTLNQRGLVKGTQGFLKPNDDLTKAQIATVLFRHKYGNSIDNLTKEATNYINKHKNEFKDIKANYWYAPYIYILWKEGVINSQNGYFYPEKAIGVDELLTIYGKYFNIPENDYIKVAHQYALYPFEQNSQKVTRLKAFESFYRYMTTNITKINKQTTKTIDLESFMRKLINQNN